VVSLPAGQQRQESVIGLSRGSLPTQLKGRLPSRGSLLNMFQRSAADGDSTTSVCLACQLQIHACMHALLLTSSEHACAGHGRSHQQTHVSGRICMPWPLRLVVLSSFAACIALLPILSAGQRQYDSASGQPAVWT